MDNDQMGFLHLNPGGLGL